MIAHPSRLFHFLRMAPHLIALLAISLASCSRSDPGTTPDSGANPGPRHCATHADCDDHFDCTTDWCSADGLCVYLIGPTLCPLGQSCTLDQGCVFGPPCATTAQCQELWKDDTCKMNIKCNATSSRCTFEVLDRDRDRQPPIRCGGADCDDDSPTRSPANEERCDGVDNDCNGVIDDHDPSCGLGLYLLYCTPGGNSPQNHCECRPEFVCRDFCTDKQLDVHNCGACGNECSPGMVCRNGMCQKP